MALYCGKSEWARWKMARLNQDRSLRVDDSSTHEPFDQCSPSSKVESQTKSQKPYRHPPILKSNGYKATNAEDHRSPQKQQRFLKLSHVDSFLLHPISRDPSAHVKPSTLEASTGPTRIASPRKAKQTQTVQYAELHGISDHASDTSDWDHTATTSEEEEEASDHDAELSYERIRRQERKSKHQNLKKHVTSSNFSSRLVDFTSLPHGRKSTAQTSGERRPSSSSDAEPQATIRFSPPRFKSPLKKPPVLQPRNRTPSPPASPSKSKLTSPSKKLARIPPTPHRPSIDAFWNPEVVNAWNEEYSPQKTLKTPRKIPFPDSSKDESYSTPVSSPRKSSPQKRSPTKRDRAKQAAKKLFESNKHAIAEDFLADTESKISNGQINKLTEATGGVKIIWSKKLNSTAGRANWKREGTSTRNEAGETVVNYRHIASIELAEKVIDDEHRLLNVLAHEYCHLLNFMISNVRDQPHGASFKRWAALVTSAFDDRGVEVTTKHSYVIEYKYAWMCTNDECATEYERHSKSIDTTRHTCGKCKGRLEQIRPVPRKAGGAGGEKQETEYQKFVKSQFSMVKQDLERHKDGEKSPMKDVMKEVGARYRARKQADSVLAIGVKDKHAATEVIEIEDDAPEDKSGQDADLDLDKVARKLDFLTIDNDNG